MSSIVGALSEDVAEFEGAPEPGLTLFVQFNWAAGLREGLPAAPEAAICQLLACDGERCWEGPFSRRDLAGPLGESWDDPGNLGLLLEALTRGSSSGSEDPLNPERATVTAFDRGGTATFATLTCEALQPTPRGPPKSEAIWSCPERSGQPGTSAPLLLSVRFNFNEGPVVAVRDVAFPRTDLSAGLLRFFALAHGAQTAADACAAAAEEERGRLQQRREALQAQLDALPAEQEAEEERLLAEFVAVLNVQKRRCRELWQARRATSGGGPALPPGVSAAAAPPSLEQALDHQEAPGLASQREEPMATMFSLDFATQPPAPLVPPEGFAGGAATASAFSIPLTLGMLDSPLGLLTTPGSAAGSMASASNKGKASSSNAKAASSADAGGSLAGKRKR